MGEQAERRTAVVEAGATHWAEVDLIDLEDLRGFAQFDGATVISTGCVTGVPGLADAVLECGAAGYVAPVGYPEGHASFFVLSYLFYEVAEGRSVAAAVERLAGHDTELAMWRYFH